MSILCLQKLRAKLNFRANRRVLFSKEYFQKRNEILEKFKDADSNNESNKKWYVKEYKYPEKKN
jgi:hypothetical protein